jgi:ABC-type sugar transport system ATPase subunit
MATVQVRDLQKTFGPVTALGGLSFAVADGEFLCLLGQPGAGKTTTLRIIAGLERPDGGEVYLDEAAMSRVPPQERDVAMVFEDVALYPHLTGYGNLAYPLRLRRMSRAAIDSKVEATAALLHISHLLHRLPGTYSGGERRRVAVGRALVRRPRVLLLDQPLTDLDAKIRQEMAAELKRLQRETKQTMIYATHDYEEAVAMADRVLVMKEGRVEQLGSPEEVYEDPHSAFVASIVGTPAMNFIPCRAEWADGMVRVEHPAFQLSVRAAGPPGTAEVLFGIRPEHLTVVSESEGIRATAEVIQSLGEESIVDLRLSGGAVLKFVGRPDRELTRGAVVGVGFPAEHRLLFDASTGRRIAP